jgi:predicted ATP-grasp superfamily ATP-dependent carboligase
MSELVTLFDHPPLHEPVMIVALEGWIDAGAGAAGAVRAILTQADSEVIARFDADELLDHRARRPIMTITDGVMGPLTWPTTELRALTDTTGRHLVALVGAEPDHAWQRFVAAVDELVRSLGVSMVVGLGAYPAPVPHTRDAMLALTSPSAELVDSLSGFVRGSVEVPAGIQAAIEASAHDSGLPALGLWAQVPHYISAIPYPAASVSLLEGLQRVAGLAFQTGALVEEATVTRRQLDELVAGNEQHREMVARLEELYDAQQLSNLGPLPTGDELAAEVQAFLRDQRDL